MSYLAGRGRYTWILDSNDPFTRRNTILVVFLACKHPRSPRTTFYLRQADRVSGLELGMLSQLLRLRSKQKANKTNDQDKLRPLWQQVLGKKSSPKRTLKMIQILWEHREL